MELFIITAIVVASSFWVVLDAAKNKMGSLESNTPSPFKIGFGCLFIWILIFPYYLYKRSSFIEKANEFPCDKKATGGEKFAFYFLAILFLGLAARSFFVGQIPLCEDDNVVSLVNKISKDNYGDGYSFSHFGQVSYDSANEIRTCRTQWSYSNQSGILDFNVQWYDENKTNIYVTYQ
jgi:hypothetical protein